MKSVCRCLFALLILAGPEARAVVVAGANGGGNTSNNTTAAQMATQLGLTNTAFYGNVLRYSDAGSVYLGWANTIDGPRAFVLTATHINPASFMDINGLTYSVAEQSISGSDVTLLTLTQSNNIMPVLPVVNLSTSTPAGNTTVIMAGFGRERVQDATTNAFTSDAVPVTDGTGYTTTSTTLLRWGTNRVAGTQTVGSTETIYTVFSQPNPGDWLATSEAQAVLGDSGGGLFAFDGTLLGIVSAISGTDATKTQAAFGQATFFSDIATYKDDIDTAIGYTLVPEPSTAALLFFGAGTAVLVALRRRP
jgi:hypothetical protein